MFMQLAQCLPLETGVDAEHWEGDSWSQPEEKNLGQWSHRDCYSTGDTCFLLSHIFHLWEDIFIIWSCHHSYRLENALVFWDADCSWQDSRELSSGSHWETRDDQPVGEHHWTNEKKRPGDTAVCHGNQKIALFSYKDMIQFTVFP